MNIDQFWNSKRESDWRHSTIFSKTERDIYLRHHGYWTVLMAEGSYFRQQCLRLVKRKNRRLGLANIVHQKARITGISEMGWDKQVIHVINPEEFTGVDPAVPLVAPLPLETAPPKLKLPV